MARKKAGKAISGCPRKVKDTDVVDLILNCFLIGAMIFLFVCVCVVFILHFVNVVYHVDRFVDVEPSLHPWNETHLIVMYDLFNVLLYSICWYFVEDFCIDVDIGL